MSWYFEHGCRETSMPLTNRRRPAFLSGVRRRQMKMGSRLPKGSEAKNSYVALTPRRRARLINIFRTARSTLSLLADRLNKERRKSS